MKTPKEDKYLNKISGIVNIGIFKQINSAQQIIGRVIKKTASYSSFEMNGGSVKSIKIGIVMHNKMGSTIATKSKLS